MSSNIKRFAFATEFFLTSKVRVLSLSLFLSLRFNFAFAFAKFISFYFRISFCGYQDPRCHRVHSSSSTWSKKPKKMRRKWRKIKLNSLNIPFDVAHLPCVVAARLFSKLIYPIESNNYYLHECVITCGNIMRTLTHIVDFRATLAFEHTTKW